jgi:hypothetical protein
MRGSSEYNCPLCRRSVNVEEVRLRLTCATLQGILASDSSTPGGAIPHDKVALWSVALADEVLALLYPPPPEEPKP